MQGPHNLDCMKNVWKKVGCTENGYDWPDSLTVNEIAVFEPLSLK